MKNLIPIYMFLSVVFFAEVKTSSSTLNEVDRLNNEKVITATFHGAEGNFFFFTDENRKAIQFEDISVEETKKYDLILGEYIGERFTIIYDENKIVNLNKVEKITD